MDALETHPFTCPRLYIPPSSTDQRAILFSLQSSDHRAIKLADITNSAAFHSILSKLDSMAPISKKRAAIDMQGYHPLVNGLNNMTGYSSDSSNQGSSETSNSSSNNVNLNGLTSNALNNLHEGSHSLQMTALQSLSALGLGHPTQLSALQSLNHSQFMSSLTGLGLSAAANASSSSNNSANSVASSNGLDAMSKQYAKVNRVVLDKNSDEYRRRRERNNLAVKKCVF